MEEILSHLTDAEWLKTLVSERFPRLLEKILKHFYHHDDEQDESGREETKEDYPRKGIRLYYAGGKKPSHCGSPWPSPAESEYIFLLETGEFASVKYTHSRLSYKSSMIHDALTETVDTQMRILTKEEIEQNKGRIADSLLKLLAQQTGRPFFLIWEDWQDEQSHGKVIHVPEGENPEAFAHEFLSHYGDLPKYGFLIESVKEIRDGQVVSEF